MPRCTCNCAPNPGCPVDHERIAESLEDAVRERIAEKSFTTLAAACGDYVFERRKSANWPHGYRFSAWYRDKIEREIDLERRSP